MSFFSNIVQGEWGDPYGGMLDEQDRMSAVKQALPMFGASLLSQGYTRAPQSPFQGIGEGIASFQQAKDRALQQSLRTKLLNRQWGREDARDARDTERFGMEKDKFKTDQDRAGRDARRDDANFAEQDRVRQAQANLSTVLARKAAQGVRNPSADPEVISAMAQVDNAKTFGALQQEQPLPPEVERQRVRMSTAGQVLSPEAEAQRIRMSEAQQRPRLLTPEEEAQQIRITGAKAQAAQAAKPMRDVPPTVASGMLENANAIDKIDRALVSLGKNKDATGLLKGAVNAVVPSMLDRYDPEGVDTRAIIADIGSLKIHDRSGAAVSVAEFPRLRPFVPQIGDDAATVRKKLMNFRAEYVNMLQGQSEVYGEDGGFKPLSPVQRALSSKPPSEDAPAEAGKPVLAKPPGNVEMSKTIGNKTYVKINGQWYEQ